MKKSLEMSGFRVVKVEADDKAYIKLKKIKPDFVFNIAEGLGGKSRESHIPAMLEVLEIPYTGSDPSTLSIGLNKAMTKEILEQHKIPTAPFQVFYAPEDRLNRKVSFPLIVKPLYEGSSKGIKDNSVVKNERELREKLKEVIENYEQPALVENFLPGREFTVGVIGNDEPVALPIREIVFDKFPEGANKIYSYEAKWVWDTPENPIDVGVCPAKLPAHMKKRIEKLAVDTYRVLECRDWSRVDIRLGKRNRPYVLEINPLPGIPPDPSEHGCLPSIWYSMGLKYEQLINTVLYHAMKRYGIEGKLREAHIIKDLKREKRKK
ncbi:MAG: ATP-grasp domain-containing protein [Candidatus Woesearchaeota archaeon]|nr:ATP-grasp domain-containing protein [Candidatus Woesearchaeota archaeon]